MRAVIAGMLFLVSCAAQAQNACTITGPAGYSGPVTAALTASCSGVVPPPPPPPPPPSGCSASQLSTLIGGRTLQRQCSGQVLMLPSSYSYTGNLYDLGTVLNGTYPTYMYSGKSPSIQITTGYYVALSFVPTATGAIQFAANPSYGDGGTISVSKTPGGLTRGASGVICALTYNASNSAYISTTAPVCPVVAGQTYYVNFADVDANGTSMCYGGSPGTCSASYVSYTLYTSH